MENFNLEQVMQEAIQVKAQQEASEGSGSNIKLIYPQVGTLRVKLLFNPASGLVSRKVSRHNVEGTKIPCLGYYSAECPICKAITSIQNAKGVDLWKLKASTRGISYAQYIDSDYTFDKPENTPVQGEVVLLMYPWTIYQDINKIIADAGQMASTVVASNSGKLVKISRWSENNQVKYKAELDMMAGEYRSCATDDEFNKMLSESPSLQDNKMMPASITDAIVKSANEIAQQLTSNYLGNQITYGGVAPTYQPQQQFGSAQPQYQPQQQFGSAQPQYQPQQQFGSAQPQYQPQQQFSAQPQQQQFSAQPQYQPQQQFSAQPQQQFSAQPQQSAPQDNGGYSAPANFGAGFAPASPQGTSQPIMPGGVNTSQAPQGGQAQQSSAPNKPDTAPECYGKKNSGEIDPNMCLICPHEFLCNQAN